MSQWIVLLSTGKDKRYAYGPIDDPDAAREMAEFMSREVDPAEAIKLINPLDELLGFYLNRLGEAAQ